MSVQNGGMGEKVLNVDAALNAQSGVMDWMFKNRKEGATATGGTGFGGAARK